jgi:hypothetical protein
LKKQNDKNVENLIKYVVMTAGEEDSFYERSLGPIHILKYLYLADYFYAMRFEGSTFTGVEWKFHNFGPWSLSTFQMIEPTLLGAGATHNQYSSKFGEEDAVRWCLINKDLLAQIKQKIPPAITRKLNICIRKFKKDTEELLNFVYNTKPMRCAAPREELEFSHLTPSEVVNSDTALRMDSLSKKRIGKLKERLSSLKDKQKAGLFKKVDLPQLRTTPRYDEVFEAGLAAFQESDLDSDISKRHKAYFLEDIWKSPTRTEIDD